MITSQLDDYIANAKNLALANLIPNLEFFNNNNCKAEGSDVAFSNCKPDAYCARVAAGTPHPVGTVPNLPPCVAASTCICEKHRWPVGLTATNAASTHIAPISLTDPQLAFDLQNGVADIQKVNLTYEMTRFLNRDSASSNPKQQKLRPDAIEHARTAASITEFWISDQVKGVHENTVWLYYASNTGMSIIFPPNNWGFLWDPTRRPWYGRAIASGGRVRAAISTPYVDGGGKGKKRKRTIFILYQNTDNSIFFFLFLYSSSFILLLNIFRCRLDEHVSKCCLGTTTSGKADNWCDGL